ncbi:hypothetical protein BDV93DRAFT_524524 [Ceratobasidium sp. AG-I]|nr:hypothetical protein BDV93DRAFT_524524 [Ceratobasidium sp. AG-I]
MPTTTAQARRKVFETPELLSLICSFSSRWARLKIFRTNKSGFIAAVPFLWEQVNGVVHLLKLLPNIEITRGKYMRIEKIALRPLAQTDYARFEFYAPFVKVLELYTGNSFLEVSGLNILVLKREQGPLLPNLSSLTASLSAPSITCLAQGQIWVTSLLSPSLKSLRVTGPQKNGFPVHSTQVGFAILAALAKICPRIRTLSLFPSTSNDQNDEIDPLLNLLPNAPFVQCLATLHGLCELETNSAIVRPDALVLLGGLPRLRRLVLCGTPTEAVINPFELPDYAFPALKQLALKGLRSTEVKTLLCALSLVRNIDTLEVVTQLSPNEGRWILDDFFPCLDNTPRLSNLSATFDEKWIVEELPDVNSAPVLNALSRLPLLTVCLNGVEFEEYVDFREVFSTLSRLDISGQNVDLEHLVGLATIPKLEHLVLSLDLDAEDPDPLEDDVIVCQSLHTLEIVELSFLTWRPIWVHETAEYLLSLFPNIKKVVSSSKIKSRTSEQMNGIRWLNSQIGMQRKLKHLRSRIADKYGQDEADSLIPASFSADLYD